MKFACFQDGKRCSSYNIKGWEEDVFSSFEEAELFCTLWAYPYNLETAKNNRVKMDLGVPVDMGMSEFPVLMEIREVS